MYFYKISYYQKKKFAIPVGTLLFFTVVVLRQQFYPRWAVNTVTGIKKTLLNSFYFTKMDV